MEREVSTLPEQPLPAVGKERLTANARINPEGRAAVISTADAFIRQVTSTPRENDPSRPFLNQNQATKLALNLVAELGEPHTADESELPDILQSYQTDTGVSEETVRALYWTLRRSLPPGVEPSNEVISTLVIPLNDLHDAFSPHITRTEGELGVEQQRYVPQLNEVVIHNGQVVRVTRMHDNPEYVRIVPLSGGAYQRVNTRTLQSLWKEGSEIAEQSVITAYCQSEEASPFPANKRAEGTTAVSNFIDHASNYGITQAQAAELAVTLTTWLRETDINNLPKVGQHGATTGLLDIISKGRVAYLDEELIDANAISTFLALHMDRNFNSSILGASQPNYLPVIELYKQVKDSLGQEEHDVVKEAERATYQPGDVVIDRENAAGIQQQWVITRRTEDGMVHVRSRNGRGTTPPLAFESFKQGYEQTSVTEIQPTGFGEKFTAENFFGQINDRLGHLRPETREADKSRDFEIAPDLIETYLKELVSKGKIDDRPIFFGNDTGTADTHPTVVFLNGKAKVYHGTGYGQILRKSNEAPDPEGTIAAKYAGSHGIVDLNPIDKLKAQIDSSLAPGWEVGGLSYKDKRFGIKIVRKEDEQSDTSESYRQGDVLTTPDGSRIFVVDPQSFAGYRLTEQKNTRLGLPPLFTEEQLRGQGLKHTGVTEISSPEHLLGNIGDRVESLRHHDNWQFALTSDVLQGYFGNIPLPEGITIRDIKMPQSTATSGAQQLLAVNLDRQGSSHLVSIEIIDGKLQPFVEDQLGIAQQLSTYLTKQFTDAVDTGTEDSAWAVSRFHVVDGRFAIDVVRRKADTAPPDGETSEQLVPHPTVEVNGVAVAGIDPGVNQQIQKRTHHALDRNGGGFGKQESTTTDWQAAVYNRLVARIAVNNIVSSTAGSPLLAMVWGWSTIERGRGYVRGEGDKAISYGSAGTMDFQFPPDDIHLGDAWRALSLQAMTNTSKTPEQITLDTPQEQLQPAWLDKTATEVLAALAKGRTNYKIPGEAGAVALVIDRVLGVLPEGIIASRGWSTGVASNSDLTELSGGGVFSGGVPEKMKNVLSTTALSSMERGFGEKISEAEIATLLQNPALTLLSEYAALRYHGFRDPVLDDLTRNSPAENMDELLTQLTQQDQAALTRRLNSVQQAYEASRGTVDGTLPPADRSGAAAGTELLS